MSVQAPAAGRDGLALVVTLVLLVALTVLGHGALVLAGAEARAADALLRGTGARLEARAALAAAAAALAADTLPALAVGSADTVRTGRPRAVGRLSAELFLLTLPSADAASAGGAGALLWAADPLTRVGDARAVLAVGGDVGLGGAVEAAGFFDVDAAEAAACDPWARGLDSLASLRPPPAAVAPLDVDLADTGEPSAAALRLGRLPMDSVVARLAPFPAGTSTPLPAAGMTACHDAPDNWGSPTNPGGPCGERRVALAVEGSLVMDGGEGQGVLAVTGDLTLRNGAVFAGLVLAGGTLTVEEGARLRGMARTGGHAVVAAGAGVEGAACPVLLALAAATTVRRPLRLPGPLAAFP